MQRQVLNSMRRLNGRVGLKDDTILSWTIRPRKEFSATQGVAGLHTTGGGKGDRIGRGRRGGGRSGPGKKEKLSHWVLTPEKVFPKKKKIPKKKKGGKV